MDYIERNTRVFTDLEAMFEKLEYGGADLSINLHNRKITDVIVTGKKRLTYEKQAPNEAIIDIVNRLKHATDLRKNDKITFVVETKNGRIDKVSWYSEQRINYEIIDNDGK